MRVAYQRVSSDTQNLARQEEALKKYDIEKTFREKVSGKDMDRPQLQAMLDFVREGDSVYIVDFSRLARSTRDLLDIVEKLQAKGVNLISLKENVDSSTPTGKLMLTMIGAINEFERQNILERQREGIAIAKREGKYKGRKKIVIPDFEKYYERYRNHEISKLGIGRELHLSRMTVDRLIKEEREKGNGQR